MKLDLYLLTNGKLLTPWINHYFSIYCNVMNISRSQHVSSHYQHVTNRYMCCPVPRAFDTRNRKCWSIPFRYQEVIQPSNVTSVKWLRMICVFF
jgi:hypothetical protein